MFQSLRPNSQIFILHKDGRPVLETGSVVSVSMPMPKYQVPPLFGQPQEMVVDLVVKVNNQDITYQKLPASADIADFSPNNIVIADSREAMNAEVLSLKNRSIETINSVEYHKDVVSGCDVILAGLNPEFAERRQQQAEIDDLKAQMAELVQMNKDLMVRLDSETSSVKTGGKNNG